MSTKPTPYHEHPAFVGLINAHDYLRDAMRAGRDVSAIIDDVDCELRAIGMTTQQIADRDAGLDRAREERAAMTEEQRNADMRDYHERGAQHYAAKLVRAA